jgi:hypothetical protein
MSIGDAANDIDHESTVLLQSLFGLALLLPFTSSQNTHILSLHEMRAKGGANSVNTTKTGGIEQQNERYYIMPLSRRLATRDRSSQLAERSIHSLESSRGFICVCTYVLRRT